MSLMPEGRTCLSTLLQAASPLSGTGVAMVDAWWRTANYLPVGRISLLDNPLLGEAVP